jgi:hypothetical protein
MQEGEEKEVMTMKKLLTILMGVMLTLAFSPVFADQLPTMDTVRNSEIGAVLFKSDSDRAVGQTAAIRHNFGSYIVPTIEMLKVTEISAVLVKDSIDLAGHDFKGAAAGGMTADRETFNKAYLGPGGSDLP